MVPGLVRVTVAGGSGAGDSSEYPEPTGKKNQNRGRAKCGGIILIIFTVLVPS